MTNRADDYRRLAQECLAIARTVSTREAWSVLIEMARVWSRLADEQQAAVPAGTDNRPHAAVQQQQQVQPKKRDG